MSIVALLTVGIMEFFDNRQNSSIVKWKSTTQAIRHTIELSNQTSRSHLFLKHILQKNLYKTQLHFSFMNSFPRYEDKRDLSKI